MRPISAPYSFGRGVADGVGNVDGARAGGHHGLGDLFQKIGIGARAVFGGELDVVHMAARQFDGGDGFIEHLLLRSS